MHTDCLGTDNTVPRCWRQCAEMAYWVTASGHWAGKGHACQESCPLTEVFVVRGYSTPVLFGVGKAKLPSHLEALYARLCSTQSPLLCPHSSSEVHSIKHITEKIPLSRAIVEQHGSRNEDAVKCGVWDRHE